MITKYEKAVITEKDSIQEQTITSVDKEEANYIHYCGHDTNPPTPCRRAKLK